MRKIMPRKVKNNPLKIPASPTPIFPNPGKEATAYCPSLNSLPAQITVYDIPGSVSNEYKKSRFSPPDVTVPVLPADGSANETWLPFSSSPSQITSAEDETTTPVEDAASKRVVSPSATVDAPLRMSVKELAKLTQLTPPTPQLENAKSIRIIPVMSQPLGGLLSFGLTSFDMRVPSLGIPQRSWAT